MSTEARGAEATDFEHDVLQLSPHITAAEALAVFGRKVPGARAEAAPVVHPFWWSTLRVRTTGLFGRRRAGVRARGAGGLGEGQVLNVLVNAVSGRGAIADFDPLGTSAEADAWQSSTTPDQVRQTARALARTKVIKTVKLGIGITIDELAPPRRVLKPNWLVTGASAKHAATILVDGLDSSHYIVRVDKVDEA